MAGVDNDGDIGIKRGGVSCVGREDAMGGGMAWGSPPSTPFPSALPFSCRSLPSMGSKKGSNGGDVRPCRRETSDEACDGKERRPFS